MHLAADFKIKLRRMISGFVGLLLLSLVTDRFLFNGFSFDPLLRFGLGGLLFAAGVALPAISGRRLTLYGRSSEHGLPRGTTDKLVTQGIYAHLRHPAFEGFCLLTFAIGLLINSPAFVLIAAPLADCYIFYFALKKEEQEAFEKFDCDYEIYRLRTPAFWPGFLFRWTMKSKFDCIGQKGFGEMKVLVASTGESLDSKVAKRFGHAPCFIISKGGAAEYEVLQNEHSGENHEMIYEAAKKGVEMFVTGNIGPHAFDIIRSLGLNVALARGMSVSGALKKLHNNELQILSAPTVKHSVHDHAHGSHK